MSIKRPKPGEKRWCRTCESHVVKKPWNVCWKCMASKWDREQRARWREQKMIAKQVKR